MVDLVFSKKLFGHVPGKRLHRSTRQHDLMNDIAGHNPWPKTHRVYGYADYWLVFGGFLFESQTMCADSRNMGEIATTVSNLSFFSTGEGRSSMQAS